MLSGCSKGDADSTSVQASPTTYLLMTPLAMLYRPIVQSSIRCRPTLFFTGMFNARQLSIAPPRKLITSSQVLRDTRSSVAGPLPASEHTSLAWLQLHDQSPISYGIQAFDSYLELIPPKTPLPCKKSEIMESAFDYIRSLSFGIVSCRTMLDLPTEIAEDAALCDIRIAKKGVTKLKVTMRMGKDLIGNFVVQDTCTRSKISVDFDGGRALQAPTQYNGMISS